MLGLYQRHESLCSYASLGDLRSAEDREAKEDFFCRSSRSRNLDKQRTCQLCPAVLLITFGVGGHTVFFIPKAGWSVGNSDSSSQLRCSLPLGISKWSPEGFFFFLSPSEHEEMSSPQDIYLSIDAEDHCSLSPSPSGCFSLDNMAGAPSFPE